MGHAFTRTPEPAAHLWRESTYPTHKGGCRLSPPVIKWIAAMVSPNVALKVMQYYQLAMFIGMCFFPAQMLEGYHIQFDEKEPSDGFFGIGKEAPACYPKGKALMFQIFNVFGVQMGTASVIAGALARDGVSANSKSAACLTIALSYTYFIFNDASYVFDAGFPSATPKEGVYFNFGIWAALVAMLLSAWSSSGAIQPKLAEFMPSGIFGTPMLLMIVSNLFYVIGCVFFRGDFFEMFFPGWEAMVPPDVKFMLLWMTGNLGKLMLTNTLTILAVCSADPSDEVKYRLLRACSIMMVFFLGSFSKDALVSLTTGWSEDMRVPTFIQNFAVTFYVINAWANAKFALK